MSTRLGVLKPEYQRLWDSCEVKSEWLNKAKDTVEKIRTNRDRYLAVQQATQVPWYFTAVIHNMECSLNFTQHLHNGDSLKKRTCRVPANRPDADPIEGWDVGYTWEESAIDALKLKEFNLAKDWSIAAILWRLELYNGFGYRQHHPEVLTPYLWSGTNHYDRGKYSSDGVWNPKLVSEQVGAAALLKLLLENENLEIEDSQANKGLQEKGEKSILAIAISPGTFLKLTPKQSAALSEEEKVWMEVGKTLTVAAWVKEDDHFFITLDEVTIKEKNCWYIFSEHCHLKAASLQR